MATREKKNPSEKERDQGARKQEQLESAARIVELLSGFQNRRPAQRDDYSRDDLRVFVGITCLERLVWRELAEFRRTRNADDQKSRQEAYQRAQSNGLFEALDIVQCLTKGTDHPVWRYLKMVRGRGRGSASDRLQTAKAYCVGMVRALMELDRQLGTKVRTETQAAKDVAHLVAGSGIDDAAGQRKDSEQFGNEAIRKWVQRGRLPKASADHALEVERRLIDGAKGDTARMEQHFIKMLVELWEVSPRV